MAVPLNLVTGLNSRKLQATYENGSRSGIPKIGKLSVFFGVYGARGVAKCKRRGLSLAAGSNQVGTDTNEIGIAGRNLSDENSSAVNQPSLDSSAEDRVSQQSVNNGPSSQSSEASTVPSEQSLEVGTSPSPDSQSTRRSPLTARERLRAARVLSRYTESKTSKSDMGSKVLEVLRESDRGKKRSRLPEAPTNLFDDSKRGLPKQGLTFQFPGGSDLFVIVFSFVFISTVMFATTYIVWKVGAIHFNEY